MNSESLENRILMLEKRVDFLERAGAPVDPRIEIEKINKFCERQTIRMNGFDERLLVIKKWAAAALERIDDLEKENVFNLGIDSLLCPIIKARNPQDFRQPGAGAPVDPRIGHLCWVWDEGENPKTSAYKIKKIHPRGFEIVPPCAALFTKAELVKPEEL